MNPPEENPFTDAQIAAEWINSVENEKGSFRDRVIYPYLQSWAADLDASKSIVEIGAGQGICAEKLDSLATYVGVEPSAVLLERAQEMYSAPNRTFILGDAYHLPIEDTFADAAFAVNVWFHLENLKRASEELARILKPQGKFLIVTADPTVYDAWEAFYESPEKIGKRLSGKVNIPVNPLSKNIFYQHALEEMRTALETAGLEITQVEKLGAHFTEDDEKLFIVIEGNLP